MSQTTENQPFLTKTDFDAFAREFREWTQKQAPVPERRWVIEFSPEMQKIAAALVRARKGFSKIVADQTADVVHRDGGGRHSYKYAELGAVIGATTDPLTDAGVVALQGATTGDNGTLITVETMLLHESGEWCRTKLSMKATNNTPQGVGSAITYARRYALQALLGVAPEDDDGRQGSGRDASAPNNQGRRTQQTQQPSAPREGDNNPAPPSMKTNITKLLGDLKLEERDVMIEATAGAKQAVEQLTFVEGNTLLQALQKRKREAAKGATNA